jgi:hypothetical protein
MNPTRNGKIARLPRVVRQELNRRLDDGEQGKKLVVWLNALPEVHAVVAAEFGGKIIREQNISEWKQGGYRDWVAQQEALEVVERLGEDATEWDAESRAPITDTLAHWLAARYAAATRRVAETGGREGWHLLREMCGDIVELRKGDHSAERLQIERERLALERQNAANAEKWREKLAQPTKKSWRNREDLSAEDRARQMKALVTMSCSRQWKGRPGRETIIRPEFQMARWSQKQFQRTHVSMKQQRIISQPDGF